MTIRKNKNGTVTMPTWQARQLVDWAIEGIRKRRKHQQPEYELLAEIRQCFDLAEPQHEILEGATDGDSADRT